jgi:hypothetical protein
MLRCDGLDPNAGIDFAAYSQELVWLEFAEETDEEQFN